MNITVVISSYKYGHLAAQCIDSVLSQTFPPHKILFVDDGVGDCKHLDKIYPEVEFIHREENLGVVDNFNDMLSRVKTPHVMFLGADNWLRPDTIDSLRKTPGDIVTYDVLVTGTEPFHEGTQSEKWGYKIWKPYPRLHGSSMYNVKLAKEVGGYARSEEIQPEEDRILFERMQHAGAVVKYLETPLLFYRRHRENYTSGL